MLNSMYCTIMQYRLSVGLFHSDIKSGDCFVADTIFAANVNTTKKRFVIYCKTRYLVHNYLFIASIKLLVTSKLPSAIRSQKSKYICALLSLSGTSLIILKLINGVLNIWHV